MTMELYQRQQVTHTLLDGVTQIATPTGWLYVTQTKIGVHSVHVEDRLAPHVLTAHLPEEPAELTLELLLENGWSLRTDCSALPYCFGSGDTLTLENPETGDLISIHDAGKGVPARYTAGFKVRGEDGCVRCSSSDYYLALHNLGTLPTNNTAPYWGMTVLAVVKEEEPDVSLLPLGAAYEAIMAKFK